MNGLVVKLAVHVEIVSDGFKTDELAQGRKRLHLGELGVENIALELQKLKLDFEQVPFAHIAGFEAGLADVDGLLEAVEVLLREVKCGLCQQRTDELLRDVECERSFVVRDGGSRDGGLVPGGLEPVLAFFSDLKEVADTDVELGVVREIVRREIARLEDGKELRVPGQYRVRAKIRGDFLGLILQNRGARRQERVVMLQSEPDGFFERDARGSGLR